MSDAYDAQINIIKLVGYGVDTLIVNVRYYDKALQPVQQELESNVTART